MRKLVFFVHSTLDGFIAKADDELWERFPWGEQEMAFTNDFFRTADTWVLGRRMYDVIVPWWAAVADGTAPEDAGNLTAQDREFADLVRGMTLVVVSRTVDEASGARIVISDDVAGRLATLKQQPGKDILLSCGPSLLATLAEQPGLVDQYLMIVHPAALGSGRPVFGELHDEVSLELLETHVFAGGCVVLRYQPSR